MKSLVIAVVVALAVAILLTPSLIKVFTRRGLGPEIHDDGLEGHPRRGVPTLGGAAIIVAIWAGYVVSIGVQMAGGGGGPTASGLLLLFLSTGLTVVGAVDDYLKIQDERSLGLNRWVKLISQLVVAGTFGVLALRFTNHRGLAPASVHLSYARDLPFISLGVAGFVIFTVLVSAAWSKAVQLTDGLNGLAAGSCGMILGIYTFIGFYQYRKSCFGGHLSGAAVNGCYQVRDPLDIATIAAAALGACFGVLWWNAHPGRISLGNAGSSVLGGLITGLCILSRTELLAVVIGALAVAEALSLAVQVAVHRTRKIRVFKTAPLHQHFQLAGWAETTVMVRFWVLAGISAALGAALFYTDWLSRTGG